MAGIETIQDPKTDYVMGTIYTGRYDYVPCTALSTLPTAITTAGGQTETWNLPSGILADVSNIEYRVRLTCPATASVANFLFSNMVPLRQMVVRSEGVELLNLSDFSTYTHLVSYSCLTKDRLQEMDKAEASDGDADGIHQFARSGVTIPYYTQATAVIPSATVSGATRLYTPVTTWAANQTTDFMGVIGPPDTTAATATNSSIIDFPYYIGAETPVDLFNATATNSAAPQLLCRFKMGDILKGTFFNIKKDVFIPGTLTISITWEATTKWYFESAATSTFSTITAASGSVAVALQQLLVPVQRDARIIQEVTSAYRAGKLNYVFDTPILKSLTLSSTSQIPIQSLAAGVFTRIKAQIWAIYHPTQSGTTAFERRMDTDASTQKRLTSFYTQINDQRVQSTTVNLANGDDWVFLSPLLKNCAAFQNYEQYKRNWIWCELYGIHKLTDSIESDELQGYDNTVRDYNYTVQATCNDRTNLWFMCVIGQRVLSYDGSGRMVIKI